MIKSACGLAALLTLVCANAAFAQQSAPTAEAQVTLSHSPKGNAVLTLEGKCPNLPDGTKLHVRMVVAKANVEGAFFMTAVTGERFRARKVFAKRKFAPLPYVVTVELLLADQRQAIGRLIRQTWGLPSGARVLMIKKAIQIGTPEEEAEFRLSSIRELLVLSGKALECCDKLAANLAKPAPAIKKMPEIEDEAARKKAQKKQLKLDQRMEFRELSKFVRPNLVTPFDAFRNKYVVLQEQGKVSRLLDMATSLGPVLRLHHQGSTPKGKARLDAIRAELVRMQDELKSRLPKQQPKEGSTPESSDSK